MFKENLPEMDKGWSILCPFCFPSPIFVFFVLPRDVLQSKTMVFYKKLQLSRFNFGRNITEMCFGFGIRAFSLSSTQTGLPSRLLISL